MDLSWSRERDGRTFLTSTTSGSSLSFSWALWRADQACVPGWRRQAVLCLRGRHLWLARARQSSALSARPGRSPGFYLFVLYLSSA
jgi:hypothetical protein